MTELLRLGMNPATTSPEGVQRIKDELFETGIIPRPDGSCAKDGCDGQVVWRLWLPNSSYRPPPCCIKCQATYRATPPDTWLPLLPII